MPTSPASFAPKGHQRMPGAWLWEESGGLAPDSEPQSGPLSNTVNPSPRSQDTSAPEAPLNAAGSSATPFALDQQNSTAHEGADHPGGQHNDSEGKTAASKSHKKPPRTGADANRAPATRESGMQVLCNSHDVFVGRLDVTNVGGDVIHGISAEELQIILAQFRAITPVPRNIGRSSANSLILTDALGEELTLCCSSVQTYEGLERFLAFHFHNKIGEQRVLDGRYSIAQAGDGREVSRWNWETVYALREPLLMSMSIEQVYDDKLGRACPKCGETEIGVMRDGGLQQWCVFRYFNGTP